jgi:hypothetical protein
MPLAEFEPAIPASYRAQTHALDRVATEIGHALTRCLITVKSLPIAHLVSRVSCN